MQRIKEKKSVHEAGKLIIDRIVNNRLRISKNTFIGIFGDSGEGKSYTGLKICSIVDDDFDPEKQVIYEPTNFLEKIQEAKEEGYKTLMLDEAHTTVDSKTFMSFINKAVTYVASTFRGLHNLCLVIIAPNVNWIEKRIRFLLHYYGVMFRKPTSDGKSKAIMKFYEIGFNYFDLRNQRPYLKSLYFWMNGKTYKLNQFEIGLPDEDVVDTYEKISQEYKAGLLENQIKGMQERMEAERDKEAKSVEDLADKIMKNEDMVEAVFKKRKTDGQWKIQKTETKKMFDLSELQYVKLENELMDRIGDNND